MVRDRHERGRQLVEHPARVDQQSEPYELRVEQHDGEHRRRVLHLLRWPVRLASLRSEVAGRRAETELARCRAWVDREPLGFLSTLLLLAVDPLALQAGRDQRESAESAFFIIT